jgi:AcrR family transcriptional regulator
VSTREQILEAAGPIFADQGFQAATVREICGSAGVNVAAINYYFGDKQRLYVETVTHAYRQRLDRVPVPQWPASTQPEVKLFLFISALLDRMVGAERTTWQARLMAREVLQPTEACRALVQEYFRPQMEMLMGIIAEIVPRAASRVELQRAAFSVVGQCVFYRLANEIVELMVEPTERETNYAIPALAKHIAQFSLAALGGNVNVLEGSMVFPYWTERVDARPMGSSECQSREELK